MLLSDKIILQFGIFIYFCVSQPKIDNYNLIFMNRLQNTAHLLMIRPAQFSYNAETATNNAFQNKMQKENAKDVRKKAIKEFDAFVKKLREAGIVVNVVKDSHNPPKPDAVFPNNWVSFHQEGFIMLYPMMAESRRKERRMKVIEELEEMGYKVGEKHRLEYFEKVDIFLEGTGSMIFDHVHRLVYACLSPRTHERLLDEVEKILGYKKVVFHSTDQNGQDIYHTNVMMALGAKYVVICMESIKDAEERVMLLAHFEQTGKEVIEISLEQMNSFAGNMLEVLNERGESHLIMSEQAYKSLKSAQIGQIEKYSKILHSPLYTIERYGGGSARCMMAEVFLEKK